MWLPDFFLAHTLAMLLPWLPGFLPLGLQPCNPLCLGREPKARVVTFRDSHSGVPGEKNHLVVGSMASHKVYYKGEGGGFPQVQAMVSLVRPCCPWFVLALEVFQLCTNHVVWVICRPVWVSETCQLFLVPSWSSNTPLYPSKCCELGNVPRFLLLSLFSTCTHIWILQGVGSASIKVNTLLIFNRVLFNKALPNSIVIIITYRTYGSIKMMKALIIWRFPKSRRRM